MEIMNTITSNSMYSTNIKICMAHLVDSNFLIVGTNSSQAAFYTSEDVEDPLSQGLQDY
jgi:hypothetical protein